MNVSVIVPTYNRESLIRRFITSLAKQTYPQSDYEIIVVDDASTDDTKHTCQQLCKTVPNLIFLSMETNAKQSTATNKGLEIARGKYILLTDDDCIPDPDWIQQMYLALQEHPVIAGCIKTEADNYTELTENISQFHRFMEGMKEREVGFIAGANMGFHKEVLDKVGNFEPRAPNPDTNLILRVRKEGYPVWFYPKAKITHAPQKGGFRNIIKQTIRYSSNTILLRNKYAEMLSTPYFLKNSLLLILLSPFLAVGKTMQIFLTNIHLLKYIHALPGVLILKFAWCIGAYQGLRKIHR